MSKGQSLHWATVGRVIDRRMSERSLSEPDLAKRARISLNTLKGILDEAKGKGSGRHHVPSLFGLAGPLEFPPDYLIKILYGADPTELADEVKNWSKLELAFRTSLLDSTGKSDELRTALDNMTQAAETVLRIAREITEDGNPAA